MITQIRLLGRVFVRGAIRIVTGLHIGAGAAGISIGGVDNPIVRNSLTMQPYIPGSSLRGKMRSLAERKRGFNLNTETQKIQDIRIHTCKKDDDYTKCDVCQVFGVPGDKVYSFSLPTRLIVRDLFLRVGSLEGARTDFLYSEIKWEASIDRVTSAAVPRPVERVPAGAVFEKLELIYSIYDFGAGKEQDIERIKTVFEAMQLLEDDYLGGAGSRGNGKIQFEELSVALRKDTERIPYEAMKAASLEDLIRAQGDIVKWLDEKV